jgi:hypothetical protein
MPNRRPSVTVIAALVGLVLVMGACSSRAEERERARGPESSRGAAEEAEERLNGPGGVWFNRQT